MWFVNDDVDVSEGEEVVECQTSPQQMIPAGRDGAAGEI